MTYAQGLKEANVRLSLQMHAIVDAAKAEANRGLTSAEAEKFDALEKDYSANEESIARAEKADKISADLATVNPDRLAALAATQTDGGKAEKDKAYSAAFRNFLAHGMEGMEPEDKQLLRSRFVGDVKNAAQTVTTTGGGYLIPTDLERDLEVALKYYGGILNNVGTLDTATGNPLDYPTMNDTTNTGRILGINTQVTNTALAFGQVAFSSFVFSSDIVLIPLQLLQDAVFNVNELVSKALGERLGRLLNNKLTVGSGSGEPNGIVTAAVAAGNTVTGASGETTTVIYDDLVNLEHAVDPLYRNGAKFMFHDSTLKALKKLKDSSNRPLWQPGLTASFAKGEEPTILDKGYIINNDMAVMAASANSILFGDLTKYKYRKVAGGTTIMRLTERYADYLQVGIMGFLRADGQLIDAGTHPVAVFVNAAS
jgi:HK97 family phage major capsid protein